MIRRTLMNQTELDRWLMPMHVECVYMHVAEPEDLWESNQHDHDYNEICYVARGSGTYDIDGTEYSMEPGDVFLLPKGWRHGERCNPDDPYELRFIMLENSGDNAQEADRLFFSKPVRIRCGTPMRLKRIWDQMLDEVVEHDAGYLTIVQACLKMQYAILYRELYAGECSHTMHLATDPRLKRREYLFERIRAYVIENVGQALSVDQLADAFHYHPKYLTQLIKRETGKTLTGFILSVRLGCACELLAKTQHSISHILILCGFNNASHFFRVFKQEIGMTPAQYRRKFLNAPKDDIKKF